MKSNSLVSISDYGKEEILEILDLAKRRDSGDSGPGRKI